MVTPFSFLCLSPLGWGICPHCAHSGDSTRDREFDSNMSYFLILIKAYSIFVCTHFTWFILSLSPRLVMSEKVEAPLGPKSSKVHPTNLQSIPLPIMGFEYCRHCILFAFDLCAKLQKFQKYYLFSMGPWKHLDWCGTTHLDIGALEVPFRVKLTKMPLVNTRLTKSQSRSKSFQNNIFHVSTTNLSYSMIFVKFDQVWPEVDSEGTKNPNFDPTIRTDWD